MRQTTKAAQDGKHIALAAWAGIDVPIDFATPQTTPAPCPATFVTVLKAWWQRERQRRELAALRESQRRAWARPKDVPWIFF